MKLQTDIPLEKQSENLIDYNSNTLLLGSCFVENIGDKLDYFKFKNLQNPFGVLFHPKAIESLIVNAIEKKTYTEEDIFFHNEQWHCFDVHSKLSNPSKEDVLNHLNNQITLTHKQISESSHIIITLGTAWVYKYLERELIVANCHKLPQKQFEKKLLTVEEVTASLKNILSLIRSVNYNAQVIFTVSPVRHIKDGFVENTQSKSHLIAAIHNVLSDSRSLSGVEAGSLSEVEVYFPSYEIMMDELRDYRFYKEDMIHPNQTAINYIWKKFVQVWISEKSFTTMDEVETIQKALQHKPFNPSSKAHLKFLDQIETKKYNLQANFPHIIF